MKINALVKPELCCLQDEEKAKEKSREALLHCNVRFPNETDAVMEATDGKMLVVIPVEKGEGDSEGCVASKVLRVVRKTTDLWIKLRKFKTRVPELSKLYRRPQDVFPNTLRVIPEVTGEETVVALNAELLVTLQRAMGCGAVVLRVRDVMTPITVEPTPNGPEPLAFGVLMPVRLYPEDEKIIRTRHTKKKRTKSKRTK